MTGVFFRDDISAKEHTQNDLDISRDNIPAKEHTQNDFGIFRDDISSKEHTQTDFGISRDDIPANINETSSKMHTPFVKRRYSSNRPYTK